MVNGLETVSDCILSMDEHLAATIFSFFSLWWIVRHVLISISNRAENVIPFGFATANGFFLSLHPIGMLFARKVDDGIMDGNIDIDTQYVRISSLPYRHCRCDELKIAIDKFTFFVDSISRVEL